MKDEEGEGGGGGTGGKRGAGYLNPRRIRVGFIGIWKKSAPTLVTVIISIVCSLLPRPSW